METHNLMAFVLHHRWPLLALAGVAMLIEYLSGIIGDSDTHDTTETLTSLSIAAINKTIGYVTAGLTALPLLYLSQFRMFDIPDNSLLTLLPAFVLTDFCYYWHHYAMHKIRLLWASHSVHHSPTRLNLTAAVRLGLAAQLTGGFFFYAPLVLIGFSPFMVYGMLAVGLFYKLFLHPARAPHLGLLEYVLNTPRHHHVHHASNTTCLDRNFGGVLIVFDRMFGTFAEAPESEPLVFGLKAVSDRGRGPLSVLFAEWVAIGRDVLRSRSVTELLYALFSMRKKPAATAVAKPPQSIGSPADFR